MEVARPGWLLACGATIALSALTVANALPYFSDARDLAFLVEKGPRADDPAWRFAFRLHVAGGIVCLATGPLLLWRALLRVRPAWHRRIGAGYVLAVLVWAGPSGLYLAFFAKGGAAGAAGFLALGVLWWGATAKALLAIRARRIGDHVRWMLRSYALALSAVFFRAFHVAFYAASMSDATNYVLSLWLSLGASLVAGEALVARAGAAFPKGAVPWSACSRSPA